MRAKRALRGQIECRFRAMMGKLRETADKAADKAARAYEGKEGFMWAD